MVVLGGGRFLMSEVALKEPAVGGFKHRVLTTYSFAVEFDRKVLST